MQGQAYGGGRLHGGKARGGRGGICRAGCLWAGQWCKDPCGGAARQDIFEGAVGRVRERGAEVGIGWGMDLCRLETLCQHIGLQLKGQVNTLSLPGHLHEAAVQPLICFHPIPAAAPHTSVCLETKGKLVLYFKFLSDHI